MNLSDLQLKEIIDISTGKKLGNIIDIINYSEIRNKGNLEFLEITFQKLYEDRIEGFITDEQYKAFSKDYDDEFLDSVWFRGGI